MTEHSPQAIELAHEIAAALDDEFSFALFLYYADKYNELLLRKVLTKVLSVPAEKIKKTRGALFTYLMSQHENKNTGD
jgi:hypothetical protein